MGTIKDMIGQVFERLTVLEQAPREAKSKFSWLCLCTCGKTAVVTTSALRTGNTRSCGCLKNEDTIKRSTKHGLRGTKLYTVWANMQQRCSNPKLDSYIYYGGKGVTVCDSWSKFKNFADWAATAGYIDGLEIDREDVDGDYEPNNCRWVNAFTQAYNKNKYKSNTSGVCGVSWSKRAGMWLARISFEGKEICLGHRDSFEDAVKLREDAEMVYYGELKHG